MTYTDIVVMWNHGNSFKGPGPRRQADLLRRTVSGNLFAYAHRNDAQRRRAFQRVITAHPHNNTKSAWWAYFDEIAGEHIPFPEGVSAFRPTIDWALTPARFALFLDLRRARDQQERLLRRESQGSASAENVGLH